MTTPNRNMTAATRTAPVMTSSKRFRIPISIVTTLCLTVGLMIGLDTVATATTIGPGSALAAGGVDGDGERMNIDNTVFPNLAAGTYDVTDFKYSATADTNDIQPFLARLTGANAYEVLWVGPTTAAAGTGSIATEAYSAGSQQFTLGAATDVYAGFNTAGPNVFFGAGLTDHNNPANFALVPTDSISAWTNPDLGRSYAFEVNVGPAIPEPSTLVLAALGLLGLLGFRRRRRRR